MSGKRGRIATTASFFAAGVGIGAWAVCIPLFKIRLELSNAFLGLVLLAFASGAVLAMPATGLLVARLGTGRSTRLCGSCFAASLPLPLLSGSPGWLMAASLAVGCASGAMDVSMNAHAAIIERRHPKAIMSSFHAAFSAGGLIGAALGVVLGFHGLDVSDVLPMAACIAALTVTLGPGSIEVCGAPSCGTGQVTPIAGAWPLCVVALCCMLCEGAMTDWSAVSLAALTKARPAVGAMGYGAFSACMVVGRLSGDQIVCALGRVRTVRCGGGLAVLGLMLVATAEAPWVGICGFAIVGVGLSNVVPAIFSAAGARGTSPGLGVAMVATAGYAGFLIGPPLVGVAATLSGLRTAMILLAVAATCVALLAGSLTACDGPRPGLLSRRNAP